MKPSVVDRVATAASEKIDVDALAEPAQLKRVVRMDGAEVSARLKSFAFSTQAELSFSREGSAMRSSERTRIVHGDRDFSVETVTGDGSELKLAYVNDILFLKNNNGQWRVSRDPTGERNQYLDNGMGIWGAFYDLVGAGLVVQRTGATTHAGRAAIGYALQLPDKSGEALAEGKNLPVPPQEVPDAGFTPEQQAEKKKLFADRMARWRSRAKPAGGSGKLLVDEATGVMLVVAFEGDVVVGDGPEPARLHVKIDQKITDVGRAQEIPVPKDAIEDVVRHKMPVDTRSILEEGGVVAPLPRDAGPGDSGRAGARRGEIPDDEESP